MRHTLGEFEHLTLLAILHLGDEAYGAAIIDQLEARSGREVSQAATYIALKRLEDKGLVRSRLESHQERYPLERMREIEEEHRQAEERARAEAAEAQAEPRYGVLVGVFSDERQAATTLAELLDAGYEGTLVSGESAGALLFEIRLGPFADLEQAEQAAEVVREGFALTPSVVVEPSQP